MLRDLVEVGPSPTGGTTFDCRVSRFSSMRCVSSDAAGFEIARSSLLWNGRFVSGVDGTRIQCWDGVCRVSGHACPHATHYKCWDGSCRISSLACPPAAPAPSLWLDVSPRDAATGLPTGKRQHGPLVVSTTCGVLESPGEAARVEMFGTVGGVPGEVIGSAELRCVAGGTVHTSVQWPYKLTASTRVVIHENPLHEESGHEGVNPLYEEVAAPGGSPALIDAASPVLLSCVSGAPGDHNPLNRPAYLSFCFVHPVPITAPDGATYQARELILIPEDPTAPAVEDLSLLSVSLQIPGFVGGTDEFGVDGVFTGPLWHHGLAHLWQGSCSLEAESPDRLVVSNIGSSGQDGVRINLEHAGSFRTGGSGGEDRLTENVSLNFQPVPLTFHLGGGGGAGKVSFSATGSPNPAGGPPVTLGVCALDTDSDGDLIPIEIDFTDHGVDQAQILILQDGFPVGAFLHGGITFPYVIGSLRSAGGIAPALVGGGAHSSRRVPGGWDGMCYSMRFDESIEVVFPGDPPGTGFVGNELRVCPGSDVPTPVPSVAGLYAFELTVTDNPVLSSLPQLVITDLPRNDFGAWLQLHFSPQEIEVLAAQNFQGDFDCDGCPDVCEFVEGTDPRVAESPHGRGVGFGTLASPYGFERIRLSYFTADIAGADVRLRSTLDLDQWNEDPSQFQLIRRDPQPDGRTRWEWEVLAPLGSKSREFYGHVTVLK